MLTAAFHSSLYNNLAGPHTASSLIGSVASTDTTVPPGDALRQPADQWELEVGFAGLSFSLSQKEDAAVGGNWTDGEEREG